MASEPDVFLRKATGLVRSWSVTDAFIYAFFSINLVTLGLYIMSQAWYFQGGLIPALLLGALFVIPETVVYASLIAAMPRAGGDYVWQSRILGGGLGYVLSITGWCFILWLWTPLYADMLRHIVIVPLGAVLGFRDFALAVAVSPLAWFVVVLLTCVWVVIVIAKGMKTYARVQKFCFWIGNAGLLVVVALFVTGNPARFPELFDKGMLQLFGVQNAYQAVERAGAELGPTTPLYGGGFQAIMLLLPYLAFFNLWPNWGATLYGEIRGSQDLRKNFYGMAAALVATTALAILFLLVLDRYMDFDFFMKANAVFWQHRWDPASSAMILPVWPYPVLFALFGVESVFVQVLVLLAMSAWFFGWAGTIYLSSTRILFSASFDRLLPESIARVSPVSRTPVNALLLMVIPGVLVSALYIWDVLGFSSLTLVSTLVIAVTFFGTSLSAVLLPFVKKDLYKASPLVNFRIGKIPLVSVFGLAFCLYLLFLFYQWFIDPLELYGISYRNVTALVFTAALYAGAAILYAGMRAWRRSHGIDVDKIYGEIPVE
ncbi:MAG: APC family permease [Clostridia bacterium]|jgi:amino acid transporter|nr:APC family permease [Spirochaetia bacterium]